METRTVEISLSDVLKRLQEATTAPRAKAPPVMETPQQQVALLKETCDLYQAKNPFTIGQLVTPRLNTRVKGNGEPHIVIEALQEPIRNFQGDCGDTGFGSMLDVRVISLCTGKDHVVPFWLESASLEPYVMPEGDKTN